MGKKSSFQEIRTSDFSKFDLVVKGPVTVKVMEIF